MIGVPAGEARIFAGTESKEMRTDSATLVQVIEARIKKIEKLMLQVIQSDPQVEDTYKLIISVPGFGIVTASYC
jgi:hypothetical protein